MPKQFIVVMEKIYPFGQLGEVMTEDTRALVKKTLKFSCEEEKQMINTMIHLLKTARHNSLINLEKVLQGNDEIHLCYQYAPFKLQKWIVTVNQQLVGSLKKQMVDLAEDLTRMGIKYTFNPDCLGLSKDMTIKYFLNEFTIDFEGQQDHFEELKVDIHKFFEELVENGIVQEGQVSKQQCKRMQSLSTNASISPLDELITLTTQSLKQSEEKGIKKIQLSAKVQSSMKKSLQALLRFKKMNSK